MLDHINYEKIPEHCRDGMKLYIENGIIPGHFLQSIICNNFVNVVAYADSVNSARLKDYADFMYNEAPSGCWGSEDKMLDWSEKMFYENRKKTE